MKKNRIFKIEFIDKYEDVKKEYIDEKFNIVEIDCRHIKIKYDIFKIFSIALKFPEYFGKNWDAFYDCITDFSWLKLKNSVILVKNIEEIVQEDFFETFIHCLIDAHDWWEKENIKFDFIIFIPHTKKESVFKILEKFGTDLVHKTKEAKSK